MKNKFKKLKNSYKTYFIEEDSNIVLEVMTGLVAIGLYSLGGIKGFLIGFVIIDILGFIITEKNMDKIDGNPMIEKSHETVGKFSEETYSDELDEEE